MELEHYTTLNTEAAGLADELQAIRNDYSSILRHSPDHEHAKAYRSFVSRLDKLIFRTALRQQPSGWNEAIEAAADAMPSTAEDPNGDDYQRGRFDGILEYQRAIRALSGTTPEEKKS